VLFHLPHLQTLAGREGEVDYFTVRLRSGVDPATAARGLEPLMVGTQVLSTAEVAERASLRLREVGLVFQRFHLLPMLTAIENVELPLAAARVARRERRERAAAVLERVGLEDRLRHRPGELSGGECQRVAVARALANDPAVVLADEPTGELDRATSRRVLTLFQELNSAGTTLVVATHDLELADGARRRIKVVDGRTRP